MTYAVFLDDLRYPDHVNSARETGLKFLIARCWYDLLFMIEDSGMPNYIAFDHDLGENEPTGYDIAKKLCEMDMSGTHVLPTDFRFSVHSQNPVGAKNITEYLQNYLKAREEGNVGFEQPGYTQDL